MELDTGKMENQTLKLVYEQPYLKKYGTMRNLTLGLVGSGGVGEVRDTPPGGEVNKSEAQPDCKINRNC